VKLIWARQAERARADAINYIASDNVTAAQNMIGEIERQVTMLTRFPELGRPGRIANVRELVIHKTPFIVVYRINLNLQRIELFRFLHTSQRRPAR